MLAVLEIKNKQVFFPWSRHSGVGRVTPSPLLGERASSRHTQFWLALSYFHVEAGTSLLIMHVPR